MVVATTWPKARGDPQPHDTTVSRLLIAARYNILWRVVSGTQPVGLGNQLPRIYLSL
jgi:hypothetical protein